MGSTMSMASRKRDPPFDTQVIHKRWQLALGRVKMQAKSLEDQLYELTTTPINLIARGTPTIRSKGERTERSYIAAPRTQISLPPKHSDHTITNRKSKNLSQHPLNLSHHPCPSPILLLHQLRLPLRLLHLRQPMTPNTHLPTLSRLLRTTACTRTCTSHPSTASASAGAAAGESRSGGEGGGDSGLGH